MLLDLIDTGFSPAQLGLLSFSLLLLLFSLWLYHRQQPRAALLLLVLGAFSLRIFMILLDPFLNDWDERYHALVAKNMIDHPFKPMLWAETILPYNYQAWCCNHIWVHKQPFFLWQMALSMKIFGVTEWAMRLPSAIMGALQVLLIYRIGGNLGRRELGYIAAFLFALSYFQLEQTAGAMGRDHNDVAFAFYLTAGFWALSEFLKTGKRLVLIGLFAGIGILTKWVVGLVIFAAWGVAVLWHRAESRKWSRYREIAIALGVSLLVALPWQLYIFVRFPEEASFVYGFHGSHLFQAYDNQAGEWWYYFVHNNWIYGDWSWLMILPGMFFFYRMVPKSLFRTICFTALLLIYGVFSLAGTKSPSYVFFVNMVIFLFLAAFILGIRDFLKKRIGENHPKLSQAIFFLLTIGVGFLTLQHWKIEARHIHGKGVPLKNKVHNTQIYRMLDRLVPEDYVVFNCWESVEAMFYTDRTCYFWLGPEDYLRLKAEGVKMAVFQDHKYLIPGYMKEDPQVLIIEAEIWLD